MDVHYREDVEIVVHQKLIYFPKSESRGRN